jgi:predicted MFS family arabinose efflux permease
MTQLWQRRALAFGYWSSTFCEGASGILIPLYFASIGISVSKIAVLFVTYEIFGLFTSLYAGFFIGKVGYRNAFLVSLSLHSLASLGYVFLGLGPVVISIVLLNVLRAFRGIAKELIKTTSASYCRVLSDHYLDSQILLGGKETLKGIGFFFGGVLISFFSFKVSFLILGAISVFFFFFSSLTLYDYREESLPTYKGFFKAKYHMVLLAIIQLFLYMGRDVWMIVAFPVFLSYMGISDITTGGIIAINLIVFGLVQPLTGYFVKTSFYFRSFKLKGTWFYEDILTLSGLVLMIIPLLMLSWIESVVVLALLVIFYGVVSGFATAPHNYLHIRFARRWRISLDISFYKTISQIGKVVAVILSGIIYHSHGFAGCLVASSVILFFATLFSQLLVIDFKQMKLKKIKKK